MLCVSPYSLRFVVEGGYCTTSFSDANKPSSQPRNLFLNNTELNLKVAHAIDETIDSFFKYGFNYQNSSVFDARIPRLELYRPNQVYIDNKEQKQVTSEVMPGADAIKRAIIEPGFNARFEVAYKW